MDSAVGLIPRDTSRNETGENAVAADLPAGDRLIADVPVLPTREPAKLVPFKTRFAGLEVDRKLPGTAGNGGRITGHEALSLEDRGTRTNRMARRTADSVGCAPEQGGDTY